MSTNPIDSGVGRTTPLPPRHNIRIYQGDDFTLTMRIMNVKGKVRTPKNLTAPGIVIKAQIRADQDRSSTKYADFTVDLALGADGFLTLKLTDTVTSALNWSGQAYWDMQIDDNGDVRTRLRGHVSLTKDATT